MSRYRVMPFGVGKYLYYYFPHDWYTDRLEIRANSSEEAKIKYMEYKYILFLTDICPGISKEYYESYYKHSFYEWLTEEGKQIFCQIYPDFICKDKKK